MGAHGAAAVAVGVAGLGVGAVAASGIRLLLGRLRRGVRLRPGPLEAAGAAITAIGAVAVWESPALGPVLFAGLLLTALGPVDLVHHRLPDAITLPAVPVAAVLLAVTELSAPQTGSLLRAVGCAVVLYLTFGLTALISPRSMGRGDVKLVPTLGLLLGYRSLGTVVMGLTVAFVVGAVVALVGLALRRLTRASAIPLGPYLLLGCWSALLLPVQ